jgi:hypothetical protein
MLCEFKLQSFEMIKDNLKKEVNNQYTVLVFRNLTFGCDDWQLKLIEDKPFIRELMDLSESNGDVWPLFTVLAQHPGMTFNTLLN